ncbi:glutaredoxin family protein [Oceanobacillus halotolerans]|uniref:glutaredoxin family protein n=1 Tax=Oceanobacillus halotolerans TaxID=2663380 RepID=UPI0013D9497E|nr:glutaredoxin family protein [Oceanobacillus halotolerans]
MNNRDITIYISNNSQVCENLITQLDQWGVVYKLKNISEHPSYREELQQENIFGTPTMFIDGEAILGFQKNRIKQVLGII